MLMFLWSGNEVPKNGLRPKIALLTFIEVPWVHSLRHWRLWTAMSGSNMKLSRAKSSKGFAAHSLPISDLANVGTKVVDRSEPLE
jgi:hypothetical protein